ncbi:MAG TPA: Nramp family divalent metal transporter [Capsulimonadaceae bacterium]|jgi:manganese transport protein
MALQPLLRGVSEEPGKSSLSEVFRTVAVPQNSGWLRKFFAVAGPGYMVSVGYMDPGNWATDLAGGAKFGYALLWVILASNLMAILLQTLCLRLGLATERDLAQLCRDSFKKPAAVALWVLSEIAIIACDLAEVIGSAVALKLLFNIPLVAGVLITGADVLLMLGLMKFGFRKLEAFVIALVATIAVCFGMELYSSAPVWTDVARGLVPTPLPHDKEALAIALGIIGATVMPHNLYLHSSIVQTRAHEKTPEGLNQAIKLNTLDTVLSLMGAFFVNAAILILAAAVFHKAGITVDRLEDAHQLLKPALGGAAATLFAVALLASGQSSTITGTLAGQIIMEGFLRVKVAPWIQRLATRALAIIPAIILIVAFGDSRTNSLLVVSQVVLSMQLPFAIFPLLAFTSDKKRMGAHVSPLWLKVLGYSIGIAITALNIKLLFDILGPLWVGGGIAAGALFAGWVMFVYREPVEDDGDDDNQLRPQKRDERRSNRFEPAEG